MIMGDMYGRGMHDAGVGRGTREKMRVSKWAVRILLECNLVSNASDFFIQRKQKVQLKSLQMQGIARCKRILC